MIIIIINLSGADVKLNQQNKFQNLLFIFSVAVYILNNKHLQRTEGKIFVQKDTSAKYQGGT